MRSIDEQVELERLRGVRVYAMNRARKTSGELSASWTAKAKTALDEAKVIMARDIGGVVVTPVAVVTAVQTGLEVTQANNDRAQAILEELAQLNGLNRAHNDELLAMVGQATTC